MCPYKVNLHCNVKRVVQNSINSSQICLRYLNVSMMYSTQYNFDMTYIIICMIYDN